MLEEGLKVASGKVADLAVQTDKHLEMYQTATASKHQELESAVESEAQAIRDEIAALRNRLDSVEVRDQRALDYDIFINSFLL